VDLLQDRSQQSQDGLGVWEDAHDVEPPGAVPASAAPALGAAPNVDAVVVIFVPPLVTQAGDVA
jgi:hypothetical protein